MQRFGTQEEKGNSIEGVVVQLVIDKETPGTVRYVEDTDGPPVLRNVYVTKYSLPRPFPRRLTITISDGAAG